MMRLHPIPDAAQFSAPPRRVCARGRGLRPPVVPAPPHIRPTCPAFTAAATPAVPALRAGASASSGRARSACTQADRRAFAVQQQRQFGAQRGVAEQQRDLEVQAEAAVVEIGAADDRQVVVAQQRLAVQHARAVFVDPHAGCEQLVEIRARREGDQPAVAELGHQQAHVEAAQRGRGQRHARRFAGDEVGRGQPHPPHRAVDGADVHAMDRLPRRIRARHEHLHRHRARAAGASAGTASGASPGGIGPVLDEDQLQRAHHVAFHAQVQVAVGVAAQAFVLVVGDVDAAGVGDAAVDHHDLAMTAQVEPRPLPDAGRTASDGTTRLRRRPRAAR